MALVCYLRRCSQRYIVAHVELVDFLSQWRQLEQQRRWFTTHNKSRSFLPFSLSGAVSDTLRIYYTGLPCDLQLV